MAVQGCPQPPRPLSLTPQAPSPSTHFVGLGPLPRPSCVGGTDGEAVTPVRLQLHQLDGGAQDLVEDPRAILYLDIFLGYLLQQDLVKTDLLLAQGIGPGNLGEESPQGFLRPGQAWPPLTPASITSHG